MLKGLFYLFKGGGGFFWEREMASDGKKLLKKKLVNATV